MARFLCPKCEQGTLTIGECLEISPDGRWDELTLQLISCPCGFSGVAIYEESRRGALDSESWNHTGYEYEGTESLKAQIKACPTPREHRCDCPSHEALGAQDERGFWTRPKGLSYKTAFSLKRAVK